MTFTWIPIKARIDSGALTHIHLKFVYLTLNDLIHVPLGCDIKLL